MTDMSTGRSRPEFRAVGQPQAAPAAPATASPATAAVAAPKSSRLGKAMPWIFGFLICAVLFVGYRLRHLDLITAESGVGYAFGIAGASLMLALLLYPLRKRVRATSFLGSPRFWFRLHMAFGVLGPTFVLLHANFHLGSTNSNVALWSMLIVAGSGLFGRYIYTRIHLGLYGRKTNLAELRHRLTQERDEFAALFAAAPRVRDELSRLVEGVLAREERMASSVMRYVATRFAVTATSWRLRRLARADLASSPQVASLSSGEQRRFYKRVRGESSKVLTKALNMSEFSLYDRLFSLWHILHLPLVFMLVITAIVHVVAVHFY